VLVEAPKEVQKDLLEERTPKRKERNMTKANPYSGAFTKDDPQKTQYWDNRKGEGANGKGDWKRPTKKEKFDKNFDKIDWTK